MKTILKKSLWFRAIATLSLAVFLAVSCEKKEQASQVSNVNFTPCQQDILKSNSLSDKTDVAFTNKGVQITYYNFAVTCDFTTVNVTHTFVNGVLNITQQGSPNQAKCICYTDVSYTIEGISQDEVNVIFINGVQVYCHNENYPIEILFEKYSLPASCQWTSFEPNKVIIINSDEKLRDYIVCADDDYSKIDFLEHSLLLTRVWATSGIRYIDINFSKEATNEYALNVLIHTDMTAVASGRLISIITPKIDDEATIMLNVQQINN